MKSLIIGAGPVGTLLAWKLAKKHDVTLVEEHANIGAPVQCTGILTDEVLEYTSKKELKEVTKAIVKKTIVHSPNHKTSFSLKPNYIVDNIAHCQMQAKKAQDAGVNILTRTRYIKNTKTQVTLNDVEKKKQFIQKPNYLIGADGPTSLVAKNNNLYGQRKFLTGVQMVMKMKDYDEDIHFWPYIGEYAWYCPEGDGKARIGIAARKNAKHIFDDFIKRFKGTRTEMQGGPIPLYKPFPKVETNYNKMKVQLIGDSVPLIKNTTGGGIIPGAKAALTYAKDPENYSKNLSKLKYELLTHYIINKAMQKFSETDWDKLLKQASDPKVKKIIKNVNRDKAFPMAVQLLTRKPSMWRWGTKIL